jgi:hypothetical protein
MDFDGITTLSYPKIVTEMGGAVLFAEKLDQDYQNDTYRMRLQLVKPIFVLGPIQKIDEASYCVITYKNPVRYFYEPKLDSNSAQIQTNKLREKDQTKDVTFEPKRNSFNVRRTSKLIAVADSSTEHTWKFINLDDVEQRSRLNNILNETVKKQLGL